MPMRRLLVSLTAAVMAGTLLAGPAGASRASGLYTRVLHAYQANGRVPPCEFTSPQLASALNGMDTYGQQYYADFIAAINAALTARAGGVCSGSHHRSGIRTGRPSGGTSARIPGGALPSSVTAPTSSGLPLPMLLVIVLGALLAAAVAVPRWARVGGRGPLSDTSWRHAASEARYRMAGAWLELRDRLRR
jgi:hypothetical protein